LLLGVDLARDGAPYVERALRDGLIINCTHGHVLRLLPPFIVRARQVEEFLKKFEVVLQRTQSQEEKPVPVLSAAGSRAEALVRAATR
jgi:acetylornithine/succinyldiaminopimelate/putrescine aminotransferase